MLYENSYGIKKRLLFIENAIKKLQPRSVLDIGCGTGTNITYHIAKIFPEINFLGVDVDKSSIEFAKKNFCLKNLNFMMNEEIPENYKVDLIIASEVIEHVEKPEELMLFLKAKIHSNGIVILTLPNGYGPSEAVRLVEILLRIFGIYPILMKLKQRLFKNKHRNYEDDTLAVSPHINFFSYNCICKLISNSGFRILEYKARTFLCGFILDQCIHRLKLIDWNVTISDFLPPIINSGWMFILINSEPPKDYIYRRVLYERFRKYLNEKYYNINSKDN